MKIKFEYDYNFRQKVYAEEGTLLPKSVSRLVWDSSLDEETRYQLFDYVVDNNTGWDNTPDAVLPNVTEIVPEDFHDWGKFCREAGPFMRRYFGLDESVDGG